MIYRKFKELSLSALGMGTMRLPVVDGDNGNVDRAKVREMVAYAIKNGINYFDTAWGYHNGDSEKTMGEVLSEYPRESFCLATKFPGYDVNNLKNKAEIFEEQLSRCKTPYFDFYLFHNLCEKNVDYYLDPQYGLLEYLLEQKKNGRIRHLGFSTHGTIETVKRFLDAYGSEMEFCQIQLNWLDYKMQNAKAKIELLREYNIPIWVMEPLRGGKLARLAPEYEEELGKVRPEASTVEWGFRYVQSIPEVVVTLSGMSNMDQIKDNIRIFETDKPLSAEETAKLYGVANAMTSKVTLPCTACRYCTTYCPMELDIPKIIEQYNEYTFSGGGFLAPMIIRAMPEEKRPSACIGCRSCEAVCPQNIKISEMMSNFASKLKK